MNKKFLLIAVLVLASVSGFAQAQFALYGGGAFPMGKLKAGELKNDFPNKWALLNEKGDEGYAGIGFNVGMDILFPLSSVDGLGITLGADFFYNGYNSELKDWVSDLEDEGDDYFDEFTFKKPRIMNIPIMLGARYLYEVNDGFGIFAEAGLGLNMRMISPLKLEVEYEDTYGYGYYNVTETDTYKYKAAVSFAFKAGAGIMLADHLSIGVDFYALGSSNVKAKYTYEYEDDDPYDPYSEEESGNFKSKPLKCSELVLRIGYHF